MENKKLITVSLLSNAVLMGFAAQKVNADNVNTQTTDIQNQRNVVDPQTEYNHVVSSIEAQSQQQVNQANQNYQVAVQNAQQSYNDTVTKLNQDANTQQTDLKNQFNLQVNQVNQNNANYSVQENKYLQELEATQKEVAIQQNQLDTAKATLIQAEAAAKNSEEYKEAIKKYTTAVPASQVHNVTSSNMPASAPTYKSENTISSEAQLPTSLVAPQTTAQTRAESSHYVTYYYGSKDDTSAKIYNGQLTEAQKLELADYAVTLVNSWRKSQGIKNVKFNSNVQKATENLAQVRLDNHLDYNHQNFSVRFQKLFLEQGLTSSAENLSLDAFGLSAISKGYTTMLELKLAILNTATTMIYMDESPANRGGHTKNFRDAEYMGFAIQYNPTSSTPYVLIWEMAKPITNYLSDYYANLAAKENNYAAKDAALRARYISQANDYTLQSTNKINQARQNGLNDAWKLVNLKVANQQAAYNVAANKLNVATGKYNAAKVALDNFRSNKNANVVQINNHINNLKTQLNQNLTNIQNNLKNAVQVAKNEFDKTVDLAQQTRDKMIAQVAAKKHEVITTAQAAMDAKLNKTTATNNELSIVAKLNQRGKLAATEAGDKDAVVSSDELVKENNGLQKIIYSPVKHDFVKHDFIVEKKNAVQSTQKSKINLTASQEVSKLAKTTINTNQVVEVVTNQFMPVVKMADKIVSGDQSTKQNNPVKKVTAPKVETENVMTSHNDVNTVSSVKTVITGFVVAMVAGMSGLVINKKK